MDRHEFVASFGTPWLCLHCGNPASSDCHMPSVPSEAPERNTRAAPSLKAENEELRAWKDAMMPIALRYYAVAETFGGKLGSSKVASLESGVADLRAENERLREALKRIKRTSDHLGSAFVNDLAVQIAAAALAEKE